MVLVCHHHLGMVWVCHRHFLGSELRAWRVFLVSSHLSAPDMWCLGCCEAPCLFPEKPPGCLSCFACGSVKTTAFGLQEPKSPTDLKRLIIRYPHMGSAPQCHLCATVSIFRHPKWLDCRFIVERWLPCSQTPLENQTPLVLPWNQEPKLARWLRG